MHSSKQPLQEQLITPQEVEAVPQLEYAHYRFSLNLQRYYSLTLIKSTFTIISLAFALLFDLPCFQNYFFITEFAWIINSFFFKAFYTSAPHIMLFRALSTFGLLLLLFCFFSAILINQNKLWANRWIVELLWTIHLIFYCCFLYPSIKMVLTWLRYRKWRSQVMNKKKYELKELVIVSLQSIPHKSSKDVKVNSQATIGSSKAKNLKTKQKSILSYSSMHNIK